MILKGKEYYANTRTKQCNIIADPEPLELSFEHPNLKESVSEHSKDH